MNLPAARSGYWHRVPTATAIAAVQTREPDRLHIDSFVTSPPASAITSIQVRAVARRPVDALVNTVAATSFVAAHVRAVDRHAVSAFAAPAATLSMPPWTQSGVFRNTRTGIPAGVNRLVIIARGGGVYEGRAFADGTAWQAEYPGVTWQSQ